MDLEIDIMCVGLEVGIAEEKFVEEVIMSFVIVIM